ncbi:MAG: response regulator, partial [Myxococcota bacterium]
RARLIIRSITALGRQLDMHIVAEGIETSSELKFVNSAGCDAVQGYLMGKPARQWSHQALQQIQSEHLRGALSRSTAELEVAKTRRGQPQQRLDVLLIEDNAADAELLVSELELATMPIGIDTVVSAEQALVHLERAPRPHLILLDLRLPGSSGLRFLEQIKAEPQYRCIPVVVVSGSTLKSDVDGAYHRHAAAFIEKPRTKKDGFRLRRAIESFWFELASFPARADEAALRGSLADAPRLIPIEAVRSARASDNDVTGYTRTNGLE